METHPFQQRDIYLHRNVGIAMKNTSNLSNSIGFRWSMMRWVNFRFTKYNLLNCSARSDSKSRDAALAAERFAQESLGKTPVGEKVGIMENRSENPWKNPEESSKEFAEAWFIQQGFFTVWLSNFPDKPWLEKTYQGVFSWNWNRGTKLTTN